MNAFSEGYYAGLVNERTPPADLSMWDWALWMLGNDVGVGVHCDMVWAVYSASPDA